MWDLILVDNRLLFTIGLVILGLASFGLFRMIAVWDGDIGRFEMLIRAVSVIVGEAVFILIGLYMMQSSAKKKE